MTRVWRGNAIGRVNDKICEPRKGIDGEISASE